MTLCTKNKICPNCDEILFNVKYDFEFRKILQCHSCGLMISDPLLSQRELKSIYTKEYYFNKDLFQSDFSRCYGYIDYSGEKANRQKDYLKFFKLLRTCVRNKKKHISLLDYGCGLGYLMEVAAKHNFNVSGIEYNEFAVTYIKNQYNYDVRHFDGGNDYFDKSKKFDVITFFDVIEHLTEPEKALKMAFDGLEDNGVLAILTMDMSSPVARVLDEKFEDIRRRDHIYFFSRKNLRQFLLKNNFEILKIKKFGKTFNIEALFHRIQNISLTLSKICLFFLKVFPFIKGCSLYINPGTKILIFAKKITPGRH